MTWPDPDPASSVLCFCLHTGTPHWIFMCTSGIYNVCLYLSVQETIWTKNQVATLSIMVNGCKIHSVHDSGIAIWMDTNKNQTHSWKQKQKTSYLIYWNLNTL